MASELIERLLVTARNHEDLPGEIVDAVTALRDAPERLEGRDALLLTLLDQLNEYDPYAGVGCFGGGSSLEDIRQTLARLRA